MKEVSKCAEINCSSFDNLYFPLEGTKFEIKATVRKFLLSSIVPLNHTCQIPSYYFVPIGVYGRQRVNFKGPLPIKHPQPKTQHPTTRAWPSPQSCQMLPIYWSPHQVSKRCNLCARMEQAVASNCAWLMLRTGIISSAKSITFV